jgi:hypothetical protein
VRFRKPCGVGLLFGPQDLASPSLRRPSRIFIVQTASRNKSSQRTYLGTYHRQVNSGPLSLRPIPWTATVHTLNQELFSGHSSYSTFNARTNGQVVSNAFRVLDPICPEEFLDTVLARIGPHTCTNDKHLGKATSPLHATIPCPRKSSSILATLRHDVPGVHWRSRCFILRGHIPFA